MELSWSTFVLEIVNFLVLLWILRHFLYRPVLDVIAQRQAAIDKTLTDAQALRSDAEATRERYEGRIAAWEDEQRAAHAGLKQRIEDERARQLGALRNELDEERKKAAVSQSNREATFERAAERTALTHGSSFAASLLADFAGPELEQRIVERFVTQLAGAGTDKLAGAGLDLHSPPDAVSVASAYALGAEQRDALRGALREATGADPEISFSEDPELISGLRVTIGATVLGLNVRDELEGFAGLADADQPS